MKEKKVIAEYNKIAGRNVKALPKQKRVKEALATFDVEDFRNTFLWAKYDPWCITNDILKTRVAWLCSFDVVAEHSDFEEPKEQESWA